VQTPDATNINSVVLVRNGAVTHAFDMDQRVVGLAFTAGVGTLTVTGPPNGNIAPPGYYMLFLLSNTGVPSIARFVQVAQAPDFSLSASPASQSVVQGNGTTYTVNVAAAGGYSGTVGLSVSGLPTGANGTFNPTSITSSGASTLTINTVSSTPAGSYKLTITGTDGANLTHTTSVTLVVNGPSDFTISATPASQTVSAGSSTSYTVNIAGSAGFSGTVALSVSGLPRKINASFNPSSVVGSGTSTLKISPNPQAPHGTFTVTITGSSGATSHSTTVGLTVQ
jgi:hypothetical protein